VSLYSPYHHKALQNLLGFVASACHRPHEALQELAASDSHILPEFIQKYLHK